MSRRRDANLIVMRKIIDYCNDIEFTLNRFGKSFETYTDDINCRYSCDLCVLQIGELINRLSDDFKAQHSEIPWRAIKGMRNVLVHEYDNVNLESAWEDLTRGVPELKAQLEAILSTEE